MSIAESPACNRAVVTRSRLPVSAATQMAWAAHYADVTGPIRGDLPGHKDRQGTLWDLYRCA
jgi:hypothetical protein